MRRQAELISLKISPWSERAKWALDHHGVDYRVVEHVPILGERRLRRIVGPDKPRATVPVLVTDGAVLTDSWDIVLFADQVGRGSRLVPDGRRADIERWVAVAERAMDAGRGLNISALLANPAALDEAATIAPMWLRPLLRPITRRSTEAFARKYALALGDHDAQMRQVRDGLDELRRGLAGRRHLLDGFTYADIVMATMLQGIRPVDDRYVPLGPATRVAWTREALARDYRDLLEWRDGLYDAFRRDRPPPTPLSS